jgi:uncharacterized protein YndB with AHSA1/START domain
MTTPDDQSSRSIRLDVEIAGTLEQVWRAIATGPGITAWFVPAEVEERAGGAARLDFGGGAVAESTIREWDPPRRLVVDGSDGRSVFEWLVEAQAGGTCIVRLVQSGFGTGAEFDAEYDATEAGWPFFLDVLRQYVEDFAGQPCASVLLNGMPPAAGDAGWNALLDALGLDAAPVGTHVATSGDGAPALAGVVTRSEPRLLSIRLDRPGPGIASLDVAPVPGGHFARLYVYLYGAEAARLAAREEAGWRAWMSGRFPAPGMVADSPSA